MPALVLPRLGVFSPFREGSIGSRELTDLSDASQVAIRGRVLSEPGRLPVAGVGVILGTGSQTAARALTGENGGYEFSDLSPGRYTIAVDTATLPPVKWPQVASVEIAAPADRAVEAPPLLIRKSAVVVRLEPTAPSLAVGGEVGLEIRIDVTEVRAVLGALTGEVGWSRLLALVADSFEAEPGWDAIIHNAEEDGRLRFSAASARGRSGDVVTIGSFRLRAVSTGEVSAAPRLFEATTIDADGAQLDLLELADVDLVPLRLIVQ